MSEDELPELPEPAGEIEIRSEAGEWSIIDGYSAEQVREVARLAVLQERNRCAKICEELQDGCGDWKHGTPMDCAAAIRKSAPV